MYVNEPTLEGWGDLFRAARKWQPIKTVKKYVHIDQPPLGAREFVQNDFAPPSKGLMSGGVLVFAALAAMLLSKKR